ncbi:hypothetical protein HMPREF0322_04167 [Desulfitobacterium hafniense DP7]|uniref:Uncharacterized protein n=1 Tax=Desulfitobacterium hafniense DP7 TaxID=537010 RepID=G9XT61_DESHA|nr:hypothetical protein HMPREF0322_04167 [Desulfitobacterium hafniense DP7]
MFYSRFTFPASSNKNIVYMVKNAAISQIVTLFPELRCNSREFSRLIETDKALIG